MAVVLASGSPRRRELLKEIVPAFEVCCAPVDETLFSAATPAALAGRLACEKCRAVAVLHPEDCVIGCDTVVDADGFALGKPADPDEARAMLRRLAGRRHEVHTGVCVKKGGLEKSLCVTTAVHFGPMTDAEIAAYIATDEPFDKAGGYGLQGRAARYIEGVEGCWDSVVGLPVRAVYRLLLEFGEIDENS